MKKSTKVWLFFILSSIGIIFAGYYFGERLGLFLGFLFAVLFHFSLYFWGDVQILNQYSHRRQLGPDPYQFFQTINRYGSHLNPLIYILETEECVVLSIPFAYRRPVLAISEWILLKLSVQEREALYKLMISRLEIDHRVLPLAVNQIANIFVTLGDRLDSINPIRFIFAAKIPFFKPLFRFVAFLFLKTAHRKDLFAAVDQKALTFDSSPLITAQVIDKLQALSQSRPARLDLMIRHLFLVDPEFSSRLSFSSFHMPTEKRIINLLGFYPL